jgi:flagellar P-ring protein precursor FlgI
MIASTDLKRPGRALLAALGQACATVGLWLVALAPLWAQQDVSLWPLPAGAPPPLNQAGNGSAGGNSVPEALLPAHLVNLPPDVDAATRLHLWSMGIQAPRQPEQQSSAQILRTPRVQTGLARGSDGRTSVRVRDLATLRGQETNQVYGLGLVTGLSGTGDSGNAARIKLTNLLKVTNINLDPAQVASNNIAIVWVEAALPPGVKPGRRLDARVSSLYDAESLVGGNLVWCELTDPTGANVYATASGPVTTGAFSAEGDGASARRNFLTVGLVSQGCKVEREVPTQLYTEQGLVYLDLDAKSGGFGNAVRIADAIDLVYPGSAMPLDAMSVRVVPPAGLEESERVRFISSLLAIQFEPEASSRIVINERTGVIVLGEEVRISRGAITKGNLTVTISETPEVSQPGPLSQGRSEVLPRTDLLIEEEDRNLALINGAADLQQVVEVLNVLGVTPRDMIEILQSMAQSGMLHGELIIQ